MDNFGFIHEKLDIKILILYILNKLPAPADPVLLSDLVLFDGGFTWFDYTDCLAELVDTGNVSDAEGRYAITEQGRRNVGYVGAGLPYSVRVKADRLTAPVAAAMLRQNQIETAVETTPDGAAAVSMRLSDGVGELLSLRLAVPDEEQAAAIEKRFRRDAEDIYNRLLGILSREEQS